MKLRAPPGKSGSFSSSGVTFEVTPEGSVEVPDHIASILMESHGFIPWKTAIEAKDVRSMSHAELFSHVMEQTRRTLEALPVEELRQRLLSVSPGTVVMPDDAAKGLGINPSSVVLSDIARMTRTELFAFLKAHGIIGKPMHTREDLARMATDLLSDSDA